MTPVLAAVPLALLAVIGRLWWGTWLAPGALFTLYWTLAILGPLVLAPENPVAVGPVLWIVAAGVSVFVGALIGGSPGRAAPAAPFAPTREQVSFYAKTAVACTILGAGE